MVPLLFLRIYSMIAATILSANPAQKLEKFWKKVAEITKNPKTAQKISGFYHSYYHFLILIKQL